jgi:hypothetical protein
MRDVAVSGKRYRILRRKSDGMWRTVSAESSMELACKEAIRLTDKLGKVHAVRGRSREMNERHCPVVWVVRPKRSTKGR